MTKIKTIVRETGGDIHTYFPLSTQLKDEGIRKPDQFVASYNISNIVKEGYNISYVQDVTDVDFLGGIWNFQLSALDEGGYDQDPTVDPGVAHFVQPDNGKYRGFYALNFTTDGVSDIAISNAGSGYSNPIVTISIPPSGGVQATAIATVDPEVQGIANIIVTNSGSGYSSFVPTVSISGGAGSGALATATRSDQDGVTIPNSSISRLDLSKQFDIFISFTPSRTQENDGSDEPIVWSHYDGSQTGLEIGISGTNGNDSSWRGFMRIGNGSTVEVETGDSELIMRGTASSPDPILIRVYRGQDDIIRMEINGEEDATHEETASLQPTDEDIIFGDRNGTSGEYVGLIHQVRNYSGTALLSHQADNIRWARAIPFSLKFRGRVWKTKDNEVSTTIHAQSDSNELLTGTLGAEDPSSDAPTQHLLQDVFAEILQDAADSAVNLNDFTVKAKDSFIFLKGDMPNNLSANQDIIEIGSFIDFAQILFIFSLTTFYITSRNVIIVETNQGKTTDFVFEQKNPESSIAAPYDISTLETNDINLVNDITLISSVATPQTKVRSFYTPNDIKRTLRKNVEQLDRTNSLDNYAVRLRFILSDQLSANPIPASKHIVKITSLINSVRPNQVVNVVNAKKNINVNELVTQVKYSYPSEHCLINTGELDLDYYDSIEKTIVKADELVDVNLSP